MHGAAPALSRSLLTVHTTCTTCRLLTTAIACRATSATAESAHGDAPGHGCIAEQCYSAATWAAGSCGCRRQLGRATRPQAHRLTQNGLRSANNLSHDTATGPNSWTWRQGHFAPVTSHGAQQGRCCRSSTQQPREEQQPSHPLHFLRWQQWHVHCSRTGCMGGWLLGHVHGTAGFIWHLNA